MNGSGKGGGLGDGTIAEGFPSVSSIDKPLPVKGR